MNRAIRMSNFQRVAAGLFLIALFMLSTFQALPFAGTQGRNNLSQDEQATNTLADNPLLPQPPQISSATGPVNVIVTFPSQVTPGELAAFNTAGGSLTNGPWNIGTSGFAGIINEENIAGFLQVVPTATVEQNLQVITSLNYATRLARAQNYTWDTLGLNGSSNGTIAILDTGINATHPAFAPGYTTPLDWSQTLVNWNDSTSSLSATPYDDNGHGTFIASVVASRGFNTIGPGGATVANFTANLTQQELFGENGLIGGWYEHKIMTVNVTEPNTNVTAQALFYEFSTPLQASQFQFEWKDSSSNVIQSANAFPAGTLCTLSSNVTTKVGTYDLYIRYNVPEASTFNFSVAAQVSWHCALSDDAYLNFTGIAPGSKIASVKVLNSTGQGTFADVMEGLQWVLNNAAATHIIAVCLSMQTSESFKDGMPATTIALNNTINAVLNQGILVVVAAGNNGVVPNALNLLAMNPRVLVVGATNEQDQVTYYSSQGTTVGGVIKPDVVAPGGSLLPAHVQVFGASNFGGQLVEMYGTSVAAAVVAGAVNILLQATGVYNNSNWSLVQTNELAEQIKSRILMTATETNQQRENDPSTPANEALESPTLDRGAKDIQEGYGRINIDAAAETYLNNITVGSPVSGNLTSSAANPEGAHAWASQVLLQQNKPYMLNLTVPLTGDFDLYLYNQSCDANGEPQLIAKSTNPTAGTRESIYYTPTHPTEDYIVVVKAVSGSGQFTLNASLVQNNYPPTIFIISINGTDPSTNNSWDTYTVYANYSDPDNNPPAAITINVTAPYSFNIPNQNITMTAQNPADLNYTDGAIYTATFNVPMVSVITIFRVGAEAFDGIFRAWAQTVDQTIYPVYGTAFPYTNDFYSSPPNNDPNVWHLYTAEENWTTNPVITFPGQGWGFIYAPTIYTLPLYDGQARVNMRFKPYWHFSDYNSATNGWSYGNNLDASLYTPYINMSSATNPIVKIGLRVSMDLGDLFLIYLQANNSAWTLLQTYTATEFDWTEVQFNLTSYENSFVRLQFRCITDGIADNIMNKGVIVDYISFENAQNAAGPTLSTSVSSYLLPSVQPAAGNRYQLYRFNVVYTSSSNTMPQYVYVEICGQNYTMYNAQPFTTNGPSRWVPAQGILYSANITIPDFTNTQYRFDASDGVHVISTPWNPNGPIVNATPETLGFPFRENFTDNGLNSWFVTGVPDQHAGNEWLVTNTSWDIVQNPFGGAEPAYWYCGVETNIPSQEYYGPNWDAWLVSKPISVNSPQDVHLYFNQSLVFVYPFVQHRAYVDISLDFGNTWQNLLTFTPQGQANVTGWQSFDVDLTRFNHNNITIRFRFVSDNVPNTNSIGINIGWRISKIEINASVPMIPPTILLTQPQFLAGLNGTVRLNFTISDIDKVDTSRIEVFINDFQVTPIIWENDNNQTIYLYYDWNTRNVTNGNVVIRVVAFDIYNNRQETTFNVYVNNPFDWMLLLVWIIIIAAIAVFALVTWRTQWYSRAYHRLRDAEKLKSEKVASVDAKKLSLPIITDEMINEDYEAQEGFTEVCSKCKQEFHTPKFEYICPSCFTDTLFIKTKCIYCGTEDKLDDPRNAYCKKCGSRLLRQPDKVLAQLRESLGAPAAKKAKLEEVSRLTAYPVITDDMVDEAEESQEQFTLRCKKCGNSYESPAFQWTCPKCDGDTLFLRSKCLHCDKEVLLDSPRKHYCEKCNSRLLRQPEHWAEMHFGANQTGGDNES